MKRISWRNGGISGVMAWHQRYLAGGSVAGNNVVA
jgi:hypothetical protein